MRFVDQTTFYDPEKPGSGNCCEAAVASVFGLKLEDVPRFYDETDPDPSYRYWRNFEDFCMSQGYWLVQGNGLRVMEAFTVCTGPAPRGCNHAVVYYNGALVHDPHPSRAGLKAVEFTWLLVPTDPSTFVRKA